MSRLIALIVVGSWLCSFTSQANAESKVAQSLQGVWVLASMEREGEPLELAEKGDQFTLANGKITIASKAAAQRDWEYHLDDAKSPKQVDLVPIRRNRSKDRFTLLGIYKLEGDCLTICIADPNGLLAKAKERNRPTEFTPGSNQTLLTFKRGEQ